MSTSNMRLVQVNVRVRNGRAALQFQEQINGLRFQGGKNRIEFDGETQYDREGREVYITVNFSFLTWRKVETIRDILARQRPMSLHVFCPSEQHESEEGGRPIE